MPRIVVFYKNLRPCLGITYHSLLSQVDIDFENESIGTGRDGKSVYFKDIWPTNEEIAEAI